MAQPVQYMMRVKLPSEGRERSTSGEATVAERAYRDAIFAEKPEGFEVAWPDAKQQWPIDGEGFTWVPLWLSDSKTAYHTAIDEWHRATEQLRFLRESLKKLV